MTSETLQTHSSNLCENHNAPLHLSSHLSLPRFEFNTIVNFDYYHNYIPYLKMSSTTPQTLSSMAGAMNQHRNTINRDLKALDFKQAIEMLLKAKRCCNEADAASKESQSKKQLDTAMTSLERLRATIDGHLKQLGHKWDEFEEWATKLLRKSEGEMLPLRLTEEGSLNMDMENM